jgi:eukaryotic translation initiation factor 2C
MNADYPVVNIGDKKRPIYLPVEACKVLPGQPVVTKLDPNQTREMIQFACCIPYEDADSIVQVDGDVLGLHPPTNAALRSELTIKPALITVAARVLTPPQITCTKTALPKQG